MDDRLLSAREAMAYLGVRRSFLTEHRVELALVGRSRGWEITMIATEMLVPAAALDIPSETAESGRVFFCRYCCHSWPEGCLPSPEQDTCGHVLIDADAMLRYVTDRVCEGFGALVNRIQEAAEADYPEVSRCWLAEMDGVVDDLVDRYGERLGESAYHVIVGKVSDLMRQRFGLEAV